MLGPGSSVLDVWCQEECGKSIGADPNRSWWLALPPAYPPLPLVYVQVGRTAQTNVHLHVMPLT